MIPGQIEIQKLLQKIVKIIEKNFKNKNYFELFIYKDETTIGLNPFMDHILPISKSIYKKMGLSGKKNIFGQNMGEIFLLESKMGFFS